MATATTDEQATTGTVPVRPRRGGVLGVVALVVGLVGIVAAVALPLAPVAVSTPRVSWPDDPAAPRSTMLMLTAYRPLALEATVSCAQVQRAAATPQGLVLATASPTAAGTPAGLVMRVEDGALAVRSRDALLARVPLPPPGPPAPDCAFALRSQGDTLVLTGGGRELGRGPAPDVDALATSVVSAPGAVASDLSVRLVVDDRFATTPSGTKTALIVLSVLAGLLALVLLARFDRARRRAGSTVPARAGPPWWSVLVRAEYVVDVVVVAALVAWLFLAPLTPDDGYYAAMARGAGLEGYVGNYYQLYNQGFTPFSWVYAALSWWQSVAGTAPVVQRVPALLAGVATWAAARRLAAGTWSDRVTAPGRPGSGRGVLTAVVLGVVFLAWWTPFGMGVRPETFVALCAAVGLLLIVRACERGTLLPAGLAVVAASLGATCAPSGFVALAPLVVGAPGVVRLLRGGSALATAGRTACLLAPGALGTLATFADGSLRDFLRAQELFLGVQDQETWYTEYLRWDTLLDPASAYATRAPVLVTVVALVALLVLWGFARGRGVVVPRRLLLVGAATALGFLLLWPTPSKWTMHFGTLAGMGAVTLALLAVEGPRTLRSVLAGRRVGPLAVVVGLGGAVVLAALADHGRNHWWLADYTPALPDADDFPTLLGVPLDGLGTWLVVALVVLGVTVALTRGPYPSLRKLAGVVAVPTVLVVFLAVTAGYTLGAFAVAASRTPDSWSPGADALRDPTARACSVGSRIQTVDPDGPALAEAPGLPAPARATGFVPDDGWDLAHPPPVGPVVPARGVPPTAWGSLAPDPARPGASAEQTVGRLETPWYALPPLDADTSVTAMVAGRVEDGNDVTVEYGRRVGDRVEPTGTRRLGTNIDPSAPAVQSPDWRAVELAVGGPDAAPGRQLYGTPGAPQDATEVPSADRQPAPASPPARAVPPPGTDVARLVAVDGRTDPGGWLAVTAPRVGRYVPALALAPPGTPTALSWPFALWFPCVRQPAIRDGITEPTRWAFAYTADPLAQMGDGTWQTGRGGVFGQTGREARIVQYTARVAGRPEIRSIQVYRLDQPYPTGGYALRPDSVTTPGWRTDVPVSP